MTLAAANISKAGYSHTYGDGTVKVHTGERMKIGQNTGFHYYWGNEFPFINVIKGGTCTGNTANLGTIDSLGYPDISVSGVYNILTHLNGAWIQTATAGVPWVLLWDGTATNVIWAGSNITETASSANRREYSCTSDVAGGSPTVTITGGAGLTCTNLRLLAPGEETRYNAGNRLNSIMLTDMPTASTLRVMDWQWVSSWAPQTTFAECMPYDYIMYGPAGQIETPYAQDVPMRECCYACNELGMNMWVTVPHQMTDAGMTDMATEIYTYLDTGLFLYLELANECWNSQYEQTGWFAVSDGTLHNATFNPATATATETTHGMNTGDLLSCFATMKHNQYPYALGGPVYVIRDDANNFRVTNNKPTPVFNSTAKNITAITKANPCQVEVIGHSFTTSDIVRLALIGGMVELEDLDFTITVVDVDHFTLDGIDSTSYTTYTSGGIALEDAVQSGINVPDTGTTELRYIRNSDSVNNARVNYGERMVQMWDFFAAVMGSQVKKLIGGWQAQPHLWIDDVIEVTGVREGYDYLATAPYVGIFGKNVVPVITETDIVTMTSAEITDHIINVIFPKSIGLTADNLAYIGTYRMIAYECGNHNLATAGTSAEKIAADDVVNIWWYSTESGRMYKEYWPMLADVGYHDAVHFHHCVGFGGLGFCFSMQEHLGDYASNEWIQTKVYWDAGGAPKI